MRNLFYFMVGILLSIALGIGTASAGKRGDRHTVDPGATNTSVPSIFIDNSVTNNYTNNYTSPNEAVAIQESQATGYGGSNSEIDKAMAMSAAGDTCIFDYAKGWQGCVGGGWYSGESAINGSFATRVDTFMMRFNLQSDTDFDKQAYGVGGSWHFQ